MKSWVKNGRYKMQGDKMFHLIWEDHNGTQWEIHFDVPKNILMQPAFKREKWVKEQFMNSCHFEAEVYDREGNVVGGVREAEEHEKKRKNHRWHRWFNPDEPTIINTDAGTIEVEEKSPAFLKDLEDL